MSRATGVAATERVLLGIACVITFVWAVATLVQVVLPSHPVPGYANIVMMTVAGCFFGGSILSARRGGSDDSGPESQEISADRGSLLEEALERGRKAKRGGGGG